MFVFPVRVAKPNLVQNFKTLAMLVTVIMASLLLTMKNGTAHGVGYIDLLLLKAILQIA